MIRHTVLMRLARPVQEGARAELLDALRAFGDRPPHAEGPARVEEALDLRGETPRSADALHSLDFRDAEAFAAYIADPRHVALVRDVLEPSLEGWWSVQAGG